MEGELSQVSKWLRRISIVSMIFVPPVVLLWPFHEPPAANRCFMVLLLAVMAWLNTIVPVYVTSLLLPIMTIVLKLLRTTAGTELPAAAAADRIIAVMFSSTILVLIASFVIAMAFGKFRMDAIHNSLTMRWLAQHPRMLVATIMAAVSCASFFMPCLSAALLAQGFLRSGNLLFGMGPDVAKALVMSTVVAGNIGGIVSPVSSLQSVFAFHLALEHWQISWMTWMKASIPVAAASLFLCYSFIMFYYNIPRCTCGDAEMPDTPVTAIVVHAPDDEVPPAPRTPRDGDMRTLSPVVHRTSCPLHAQAVNEPSPAVSMDSTVDGQVVAAGAKSVRDLAEDNFSTDPRFVKLRLFGTIAITLLTVVLWSNSDGLEKYLGSMGIISLVPVVLFFGLRILPAEDICRLPWDIVLMAMGTLVLNEAAQSSGLIESVGHQLRGRLHGLNYFLEIVLITTTVLVTGTLKSHFVAGLIFLPIVMGYIQKSGMSDPRGLAMFLTATMATSVGMALPLSGLINLAASAVPDDKGGRVLSHVDFAVVGTGASLISFFVICTLGLCIFLYT